MKPVSTSVETSVPVLRSANVPPWMNGIASANVT